MTQIDFAALERHWYRSLGIEPDDCSDRAREVAEQFYAMLSDSGLLPAYMLANITVFG